MTDPSTKAQADADTGKPAAGGSGFGARAGSAIRGNLFRGTGGKFQAGPGAVLQDRLAKLRAAMPTGKLRAKAGKGKKGKAKGGKGKPGAGAKEQRRLQNRKDALGKLASKPNDAAMAALDALAKGDAVDPDMAGAIADETGLAERHADGSVTLSAAGKKLLSSLDKGDAAGAAAAIAGAGDKQAKQEAQGQAKEARQQAAEKRKAEREKAKAERASKKKAGGGGAAKPKAPPEKAPAPDREKVKQERDAARAQRTAEQAKRKQQRATEQAGKEKAKAADKASKDKVKTAQKERQADRSLRSLSRGAKVGESQLLDMEDAGLISFDKQNKPQLTDKGKKRLAARTAPNDSIAPGSARQTAKR